MVPAAAELPALLQGPLAEEAGVHLLAEAAAVDAHLRGLDHRSGGRGDLRQSADCAKARFAARRLRYLTRS